MLRLTLIPNSNPTNRNHTTMALIKLQSSQQINFQCARKLCKPTSTVIRAQSLLARQAYYGAGGLYAWTELV